MNIVTLAECKTRLSIDFNTNDSDITIMADGIESDLLLSIGLTHTSISAGSPFANLCKTYILTRLYIEYYNDTNELNDLKLTRIMNKLQVEALRLGGSNATQS